MSWDDYRYLLCIAQDGSIRGAATQLGVNASTVTRRLEAIESRLGVVLFTRSQRGLQITPQGREVVERLRLLQTQIHDLEMSLQGSDARMQGTVRVLVSDDVAARILLPGMREFVQRFPAIELVLESELRIADLASGRIDVAIAATDLPPEDMIARPLGRVMVAAYASTELVRQLGGIDQIGSVGWVDWAGDGELATFCRELRAAHFAAARVQLRCDHVLVQAAAIRAGVGAGVLPSRLVDEDSRVVELPQFGLQAGPMLWLITHPDFRAARRTQEFTRFVRELFLQQEQPAGEDGAST